jgi:uncharacterized protein YndB with AHSA1/START domain
MTVAVTDIIEKTILLRAPRSRVWRALTTPEEFGTWFGARFANAAFAPGARVQAAITFKGYEHLTLDLTVEAMEPERLFSWRWHPNAVDAHRDYSSEPTTLVTFTLEEVDGGTLLTVVESGFDRLPVERRADAYRGNEGGWAYQVESIRKHVSTQA